MRRWPTVDVAKPVYVLGLNAYHGDASAALLRDGQLVAAVEEERFRRVKHWAGFPSRSVECVLGLAGITGGDVAHVAVSRNPRAHLARKVWFAARRRPSGRLIADRLRNARTVGHIAEPLAAVLRLPHAALPPIHRVEHHRAHLASAFFVSPFDEAACCAIDGFGDFVSTSTGIGHGRRLDMLDRVYFPHSLGVLYTAVTQYLGFSGYGDEFKVMGLAPYGSPTVVDEIGRLVRLREGGDFELDLRYFRHASDGVTMEWADGYPSLGRMYSDDLEALLGPARDPAAPLDKRHEDIAHSLQVVYEECAMHVLTGVWERTRIPRLCLAGGCGMNSVANGKIRDRTPFREVYIQPAAGDAGTALGAAYDVWNRVSGERAGPRFVMSHAYWGPAHDETDTVAVLPRTDGNGSCLAVERFADADAVACAAARLIADGLVVGWYQGRMEWGARALGNRSIVADPRRADIRELINTKVKFRERFRPFAPSIAVEALDSYFEGAVPDPFMIQVYPVRPDRRAQIPAVTHVDGSGRLQTVDAATNGVYYRLIREFEALTGVPVVLNTSFNENEPIVETPAQALDCFLRTRMDAIVLNNVIVRREPTSPAC